MPSEETILLWCDVESTGLPTDNCPFTVLEVGWTVSDGAGRQLTPLRQAFTKIVVMMPQHKITTRGGLDPVVPRALNGQLDSPIWSGGSYPLPEVRQMHRESGLTAEWVRIAHERPWRLIEKGDHLDGLLIDDLAQAVPTGPMPKVHLAGAGVAHMEASFLPRLCPRTTALLHYAAIDVSSELRSRRLRAEGAAPGNVDEQLAEAARISASGEASWGRTVEDAFDAWDDVRVDVGGRFDAEPPGARMWEQRRHRAATDVGRALAAYRSLQLLDEHAVDMAEERSSAIARPI